MIAISLPKLRIFSDDLVAVRLEEEVLWKQQRFLLYTHAEGYIYQTT